ncbi:hypothetical protein PHMEG_0004976 [Phytophthora megakarya]|uniref:Uncharacterized protein n=1 Tax=Phytophthora megakarya TaxID=4795 RepID=A0A225WU18_9STRA|nr:hypothetical protein PHMEG_0004976 [Phytophthora megakarya]
MRQTQEALARIQRQADEVILAARTEATVQAERFRAAKGTEERFKAQQFQTEADFAERPRVQRMQDEAERTRWVDDIAILQQQMRELEAERDREQEAAKSIQKFQASHSRDLRATSVQVQHVTETPVPDAVSQIKTESGIANFQQNSRNHDADNVPIKTEKSGDKDAAAARADALLAAKLQTTLQNVNMSSDDAKVKAKKATPKMRASRKGRRGGYPSDSVPSSGNDDSDSGSDASDNSFWEPLSDMVVPKTTQGGTTTMNIRPFVTASSLNDFDEIASLSECTRW